MTVKVLVLSGSMGAGKTTVLGEASDLLAARAIPHAAIDLDEVSAVLLPDDSARQLTTRNLAALFANFVSAGIERVLLAVAVESRRDLEALSDAMSHPELVVCRLLARPETMERRIRLREPRNTARGIRRALESAGCDPERSEGRRLHDAERRWRRFSGRSGCPSSRGWIP